MFCRADPAAVWSESAIPDGSYEILTPFAPHCKRIRYSDGTHGALCDLSCRKVCIRPLEGQQPLYRRFTGGPLSHAGLVGPLVPLKELIEWRDNNAEFPWSTLEGHVPSKSLYLDKLVIPPPCARPIFFRPYIDNREVCVCNTCWNCEENQAEMAGMHQQLLAVLSEHTTPWPWHIIINGFQ